MTEQLGPGESLTTGGYVRRADGVVLIPPDSLTLYQAVRAVTDFAGLTMAEIAQRLGNCDAVPAIPHTEEYCHSWSRPGYTVSILFGRDNKAIGVLPDSEEIGGPDRIAQPAPPPSALRSSPPKPAHRRMSAYEKVMRRHRPLVVDGDVICKKCGDVICKKCGARNSIIPVTGYGKNGRRIPCTDFDLEGAGAVADVFGYPDQKSFEKAIDREFRKMQYHSNGGRVDAAPGPKPGQEPGHDAPGRSPDSALTAW